MTFIASRTLAAAAGAVLLHFATLGSALADDDHEVRADQRVSIGFEIAKTQNIALDPNVPSQGLGSYLVTVSSCNDCHSQPNFAPGGDPYSRQPKHVNNPTYLAGGRSFPVPAGTCSANLSPAPQTGLPAGLTRAQFIYVIRTGCDPQDENFNDPQQCGLLQVMPWPNFGTTLRRYELSAIYDYLSALPHTEPDNTAQCAPNPQGVADNQ
jgi:hypothetical protein